MENEHIHNDKAYIVTPCTSMPQIKVNKMGFTLYIPSKIESAAQSWVSASAFYFSFILYSYRKICPDAISKCVLCQFETVKLNSIHLSLTVTWFQLYIIKLTLKDAFIPI